MYLFESVRKSLLDEATSSPNLLSDLAGLENYIAESYHNRSFIELLQNADDAGASHFKVLRKNNFLLVANNGRLFDKSDLESLCRSAASNKIRGNSIGYRGIGFKSVVSFAKNIHLISGDLNITFSKELTKKEIPQATNVPLIRIPHFNNFHGDNALNPIIDELLNDGFNTIFAFNEIVANQIETEFESFNYLSLLFLRNIKKVDFISGKLIEVSIDKKYLQANKQAVSFNYNNEKSDWLVFTLEEHSIAFKIINSGTHKLKEEESVVHAFLPTEDTTGLGVIINGDFNTDPSRRHIIFDDHTKKSIGIISKFILEIIEGCLKNNEPENIEILNALTPYIDPRMSIFKKQSFSNILLNDLQKSSSSYIKTIYLSPTWFNVTDFIKVTKQLSFNTIDKSLYNINGFIEFLKFLGAKEAEFKDIQTSFDKIKISSKGCSDLVAFLIKRSISENINIKQIENIPFFVYEGNPLKISQITTNTNKLDDAYINYLFENKLTTSDLSNFFSKYLPQDLVMKIFAINPEKKEPFLNNAIEPKTNNEFQNLLNIAPANTRITEEKLSLKRWRSAEQQVLTILNNKGFHLEDVSRQNIGCDLEGTSPDGTPILIEVKSIEVSGQRFRLTNNEVALAQEKQNSYYLAIVRQSNDFIEIAMIKNPIENLTLNRQCVQWIWECIEYEYNPIKFKIE